MVEVAKAGMPGCGGDGSECMVWRGCGDGVEVPIIITSEDHLPRSPSLGRDSNIIKININMVIVGKFLHGDMIFD